MNELERDLTNNNETAETGERAYTGYTSAKASMRISGSTAICAGNLVLKSKYTASCTLTLQKKVSGEWTKVASWSSSGTTSQSHSVTSGKTYRAKFHGSVKNSSGNTVETFTRYSDSEKA